jgi:hypothetical protein
MRKACSAAEVVVVVVVVAEVEGAITLNKLKDSRSE